MVLFLAWALGFPTVALGADLIVRPVNIVLNGPESTQQLLVQSGPPAVGDVTHQVRYEALDPKIIQVSPQGLIEPLTEGKTVVRIHHNQSVTQTTVEVRGIRNPATVSFAQQIIPLLTKAGCNSGGCHGKAEGQNGFKLSVFGFDPQADYLSLVSESRGRRILPSSPENSMLILKATGKVPHGGGRKIIEGSLAHKRLIRWIREGTPFDSASQSPLARIEVEPREIILGQSAVQQLRVTAYHEIGETHCSTTEAEFETNEPNIAGVDRQGKIQTGTIPGEAVILVRYMGQVTFCRVTVPQKSSTFPRPAESNFVDKHVWDRLTRLGIPPSPVADDATFLRRVFLDTIGTLPTATEAKSFLSDTTPDKRARLIDALLNRPEYADYWSMKWADLLRVDRDALTAQGSIAMTRWLRQQFAQNRPYDQFVREILTAKGNPNSPGPAGFYKVLDKPEAMGRSISQLFLGVRIECAQCHHHPSEKWSQDDYYAFAGYFTGVQKKSGPQGEAIIPGNGEDLKHPRTGSVIPTRPLGGPPANLDNQFDRREILALWMTSANNPYFSRAISNRLWSHYLGRGLIEPIDDLRITNPATNEPLLDSMAKHLVQSGFDLKVLTRAILNSRVYQLGPQIPGNELDEQNFSHALPRPLPAEVLLDAICQATGVPEKFNGWPEGVRSIQMWDNRMPSYFLKIFGRPGRTSVCECERSTEPSIAQALHLMNAPEINAKIHGRKGKARQLADSGKSPESIIDELFLGVLSRHPQPKETAAMMELFDGGKENRRPAVEDILWALMNTREFVYNH